MDEQKNNNPAQKDINDSIGIPSDFGNVIETLHNKSRLSALRTYQGDVSKFIKEKNESVISVAVKEKEREEERIEKGEIPRPKPKPSGNGFKINLTMLSLSLFLIAGGATAFFYIFEFVVNQKPSVQVTEQTEIIPYNNIITLANITKENLAAELSKTSTVNGVNLVKISDTSGELITKAGKFFDFLKIPTDLTLRRILKDDFSIGVFSQNNQKYFFTVIKVSDFGIAFSSMLDWEENITKDLNFLTETNIVSTSTAQTQTTRDMFAWKDVIVKNKDTRAFVNNRGNVRVIYTFLDKNTILITSSSAVIGDMSSAYISRSVAR